ncbi:hypothetical protein VB735_33080 [Halotia wernerae UHCC 0503]|nr:hypothetical protein [Halotia wernerae UHCC 0503]
METGILLIVNFTVSANYFHHCLGDQPLGSALPAIAYYRILIKYLVIYLKAMIAF